MRSGWFEGTFSSSYREAFSFLDKPAAEEVRSIIKLLDLKNKKIKILDLCCGWGRHIKYLNNPKYNVTGLDLSSDFLAIARKYCQFKKLVHGDIRNIDYDCEFDVILNLQTSFGYFNERENKLVLKKIYRALRPNGILLIEVINKSFILSNFKKRIEIINDINNIKIIDENRLDKNKKVIKTKRVIIYPNDLKFVSAMNVRLYKKEEFKKMLLMETFKDIQFFGDLDGNEYKKSSKRLVVLARK